MMPMKIASPLMSASAAQDKELPVGRVLLLLPRLSCGPGARYYAPERRGETVGRGAAVRAGEPRARHASTPEAAAILRLPPSYGSADRGHCLRRAESVPEMAPRSRPPALNASRSARANSLQGAQPLDLVPLGPCVSTSPPVSSLTWHTRGTTPSLIRPCLRPRGSVNVVRIHPEPWRRREAMPDWWSWPFILLPHDARRMEDRGFSEVELRLMLARPQGSCRLAVQTDGS